MSKMVTTTLFIFLKIDQTTGEILKEAKIEVNGPSFKMNMDTADHLVPFYGFTDMELWDEKREEFYKRLNGLPSLPTFNGWL